MVDYVALAKELEKRSCVTLESQWETDPEGAKKYVEHTIERLNTNPEPTEQQKQYFEFLRGHVEEKQE